MTTGTDTDHPFASVVLCVRNAGPVIEEQLEALVRQQTTFTWELLVVDNGCTDDSIERVERFRSRLPKLRVVPAGEKAGLAYARNSGAAASTAEILAFCDADDVAEPQWLQQMLKPFAARRSILVGGALEFATLNSEIVRFWRGYGERMTELVQGFGHLPHAIGANFAIARADYLALGGCVETFVGSSDEIDLCWRAQAAGMALVFAAEGTIGYRLRPTIRETMRQQYGYGRSAVALFRAHRDRMPKRTFAQTVEPYWLLVSRVHQLVRGPRMRGRWLTNAAYWAGRIRGSIEQRVWFG